MSTRYEIAVVGGGIVGLATARALLARLPGARVAVLEKEPAVGMHQTGRNSGVVHAGIYYSPGSLKARLCTAGRHRLKEYAADRAIPYIECGKLVVAVNDTEVSGLHGLHARATANGVPGLRLLDAGEITQVEPAVRGVAALHSPVTAITDFAGVARAYARDVVDAGGEVWTEFHVVGLEQGASEVRLRRAGGGEVRAARVVVCAGLWSDRLAEDAGDGPDPRIIPFRGDYFALSPAATHLVRGLVYPVPDPRYPFLGVHLTRRVDGRVLVGPNAVVATARDGYRRRDVSAGDLGQVLGWPGFWQLARRHWRTGLAEFVRSNSRAAFARAAQRYIPALRTADLVRAPAGIRAQAVDAAGNLVDDFRVTTCDRVVNVRNAPSPAATSSLAIADEIATMVLATTP